jgi:hypothetical protein
MSLDNPPIDGYNFAGAQSISGGACGGQNGQVMTTTQNGLA